MIEKKYKYYVYIEDWKEPKRLQFQYKVFHYYRTVIEFCTRGKCQGHLTHSFDFIKRKWPQARVRKELLLDQDEVLIITRQGIQPSEAHHYTE